MSRNRSTSAFSDLAHQSHVFGVLEDLEYEANHHRRFVGGEYVHHYRVEMENQNQNVAVQRSELCTYRAADVSAIEHVL